MHPPFLHSFGAISRVRRHADAVSAGGGGANAARARADAARRWLAYSMEDRDRSGGGAGYPCTHPRLRRNAWMGLSNRMQMSVAIT